MSTLTERLLERHRVDSERMWPAPSDLDLLAAEHIKELEGALERVVDFLGYAENEGKSAAIRECNSHNAWKTARAALQPKEPK